MNETDKILEDIRILASYIDHPDEFLGTQETCDRLKRVERLIANFYSAEIEEARKERIQEELSQKKRVAEIEKEKAKVVRDTFKILFAGFRPLVDGVLKEWSDEITTWVFESEPQKDQSIYVETRIRRKRMIKIETLFKENFAYHWNHTPTKDELETIEFEMRTNPLVCRFDTLDESSPPKRRIDSIAVRLKRR